MVRYYFPVEVNMLNGALREQFTATTHFVQGPPIGTTYNLIVVMCTWQHMSLAKLMQQAYRAANYLCLMWPTVMHVPNGARQLET